MPATCVPRPLPGGGRRGACSPVCLAPCMCVRAACVHTCAQVCVLTPCVCACVCAPSCAYLRVCAHVMCARVCPRWRLRHPHRRPQEFRRHLGPRGGGAPRSAVESKSDWTVANKLESKLVILRSGPQLPAADFCLGGMQA